MLQILIYSCQVIQCFIPSFIHASESNASDPHLFTSRNPMLQTLTPDPTLKRRQGLFCMMFLVLFFFSHSQVQCISYLYLLMSGDPNYFSPLAIRIRKSNIFQTLIYSHKGIQCISNSYLRTSVNPNYFKPLSTHVSESKLFHTLNPPTHILNFMFGYLACYDL